MKKELSTKEIKKILGEAVDLGYLGVRFTGGEPLLRDDFEEIYVFARKSGLRVCIFTNITLISRHLAGVFARIPPLEPLEITLYGMDQPSYETMTRVPGSYEAAWRGIELLREKKVPFIVKGTFLPKDQRSRSKFKSWITSMSDIEGGVVESRYYLRGRRDDPARNRVIMALRASAHLPEISSRFKKKHKLVMQAFFRKYMHLPNDCLFSCGFGSGCVDSYGKVQTCILLRHPACVYDLKKGSLKQALHYFFPVVRKMKASNPDYLKRCARCFLQALCDQCPGHSWMEHGTLDTPVEHICDATHAQARHLGLLRGNEKAWEIGEWKHRIQLFLNEGGCKHEH